ncbi:MAG: phospho-N-acetylmuramoyl-pentapeptide-transferase [Bacilli bacterium]
MSTELSIYLRVIITFFLAFFVSFFINKYLIKMQIKKKVGQNINKYLSLSHQNKKETPSLGGCGIFSGITSCLLINFSLISSKMLVIYCFGLLMFLIGFIDDIIKVFKQDYLGLSAIIRFLLELFISLLFAFILYDLLSFKEEIMISKNFILKLGPLIFIVVMFLLTGISNSVNLTDGLDGMASFLYLSSIIPFIIVSLEQKEYAVSLILIASFGATLGFIFLNLYPAKIFMGDCGSLLEGGILGISGLVLHKEMMLIIASAIFIFETLSVILQVCSFKLFHKRIFLMTPFHHHLELKGLKEYQVVMIMMVLSLVFSLFSLLFEVIK